MKEPIEQIFYEEVREKKTAAAGVHGKKGKKGRVGKMVTPADISSRDYREARDLPSFNVYDFIHKLHEAPTLKNVLLARMEEEYRAYRQATEKALDAMAEVVQLGVDPLYKEVARLQQSVEELAGRVEALQRLSRQDAVIMSDLLADGGGDPAAFGPAGHPPGLAGKKRIRWGSNPESIRQTVFNQLRLLEEQGEEITTETIKQRIPSMLRWIYGERAVFNGIEGLRRDFLAWANTRCAQAGPAAAPTGAPETRVDDMAQAAAGIAEPDFPSEEPA